MPISKHELSRLGNAEIARLFNETRNLAVQQKYGTSEKRSKSRYHLAPDNSVCDCGDPASHYAADERFYQDQSGAILPLAPGQERPASLEDERTERLIRMPQNQVDNLTAEAQAELEELRDGVLEQRAQAFRAARPKYYDVDENYRAMLERLGQEHLGYCLADANAMMLELLSRGVWTIENLCAAFDALTEEGSLMPRPGDSRNLDPDELRTLSAFCAGCQTDAEFERVLNQYVYLATGNENGWRSAALDSRYSAVLEQAIFFCFENSTPDYSPTAERRHFLQRHIAGRFPSVRMLRAGWELCKQAEARGVDNPPSPTLTEDERRLAEAQARADELARASWQGVGEHPKTEISIRRG